VKGLDILAAPTMSDPMRQAGTISSADVPLRPAAVGLGILLGVYALFEASTLGPWLYDWSKTWASYDLRQHLGMSKRFLWQYGHIVLQAGVLFLLPFVLTGGVDRSTALEKGLQVASKYWLPVFLFHFPAIYLIAALIDHDASSRASFAVLLTGTMVISIALGWLSFRLDPVISRLGNRMAPSGRLSAPAFESRPAMPTGAFSRALDILKLVAAACVILGHASFDVFTDRPFLIFDGHTPRFAIPLFFLVSGYLTALSLHRSKLSTGGEMFKRYWSVMPMVIPMLIVTPLLNAWGLKVDPALYGTISEFLPRDTPALQGVAYHVFSIGTGLTFLAESVWWTVLIDGFPVGGTGAFNNAPYWFLAYLIPFHLALVAALRMRGVARWATLGAIAIITGPPIWLLAPMYFAGAAVYMGHVALRDKGIAS
jgi:hypothetical protein